MPSPIIFRSLLLAAFVLPTLVPVEAAPKKPVKKPAGKAKPVVQTSIVNTPLVKVTDPVENSFSVSVPKGWRNQAYSVRTYELTRPVITSLSPDGKTLFFMGDPRLANYYVPTEQTLQIAEMGLLNPLTQIAEVAQVDEYFKWYAKEKFGKLPGFRITGVGPNPKLAASGQRSAKRLNMPAESQFQYTKLGFNYTENGKPMKAIINGQILALQGIWVVTVSGVATPGDPEPYNDLLIKVGETFRTNPQWQQQQQQNHEQRMAQLRQDAQNNQVAFNASNKAHQMRMDAIKTQGEANMKNWYDSQAASDRNHRGFMNYITDEHTVSAGGKNFQVDNSHQKYFVNPSNNTYIGTSSNTTLEDLRGMGYDPSDYKVATIKR